MTPATERLSSALAGRYRVEKQLGQGGMATVYLAQDIKHDRKVAVKVLKPELAAVLGAERFVVEIKTTASLQHPHILPLFDSGTAAGHPERSEGSFLYHVMPYIEGETLRDKLNRETQFSVDEAVRITTQVADALDYAHRHGVIHRDIKPENILLHDGRPMVADFGIALAVSAAAGGRMTETGLSLGTPHYMSPEQATAEKEITGRADIYSLASVLYEMLSGSPPHMGSSAQQIIMKIITEQAAPVTKLRKAVPPNVAAALEKALEKLPADRFESAKAFADALANATFATGSGRSTAARPSSSATWRERAAVPALALSAALAAVTVALLTRKAPPAPIARYQVELPDGKGISGANWSPLAVSPDGSNLVYMGETGRLFLRSRDELDPVELAGTEQAFNPFFSRDGKRVGFMAGAPGNADIKVSALAGGPPTAVLTGTAGGPGAAFGYDGFIYYDASGVGPLKRIRETGGQPEDASVRDSAAGELQHNWPDPLPNGRGVLFIIDRAGPGVNVATTNDVAVLDLVTRRHKVLMRGVYARYTKSGHILYVTFSGDLMAVRFDQDRMELIGTPVALRSGVTVHRAGGSVDVTVRRGGGGVDLAISETGTLWYGTGSTSSSRREVLWTTRTGRVSEVVPGWADDFSTLALSPDGSRLALSIIDAAGEQIWVKHLTAPQKTLSKLTFQGINSQPRWHPSGDRILFVASFLPTHNLRVVRADGSSAAPEVPAQGSARNYGGSWSRQGDWLVIEHFSPGSVRDIAAVRSGADSSVVPLVQTQFQERSPSISPDGRWLLYEAPTNGVFEVYVKPFPNTASGHYQITSGGGSGPKWSRDGREIFFANRNNELTRVAVVPGNTFGVADQRVLFSLRGVNSWDVAPDGQRFIMIRDREGKDRNKLVAVENFFAELNARVPR